MIFINQLINFISQLVIFFKKEQAHEFDYRAKQAGQLASKLRFLAAPWAGLLTGDVWLENARRANARAEMLAAKLAALGLKPEFPREASAVFLRMPEEMVIRLQGRGWQFYKYVEPDVYRFMCSWSVTEKDIEDFIRDVKSSGGERVLVYAIDHGNNLLLTKKKC